MKVTAILLLAGLNFGFFDTPDSEEPEINIKAAIAAADKYVYNDPEKAIQLINEISPALLDENHQPERLASNLIKGRSLLNLGQYEMAFEVLYSAYEECPRGDVKMQMQLLIYLGETYRSLKLEEKAKDLVQKAVKLAETSKDTGTLALCYNVLGLIHINLNENEKAEENFTKALVLNRRLNNEKSIAANLNNLCLYPNSTPLDKVELLKEAVSINHRLGANWSIPENYNNMGVQYYYAKDYKKALECLGVAFNGAEKLNAKELLSDNYRYKSWVYEALGNYTEAHKYLKLLYATETQMLSDKRISKIEGERNNRLLAKKQEEMLLNQKEYEIKSLKKERIIFLLGSVSILLASGFIFFKYKQTKRIENIVTLKQLAESERELAKLRLRQTESERNVMEEELSHSKNNLTNFACYIKSKNDFLENLKEEISRGYSMGNDEIKKHLKSIKSTIVQYQNSSNEQNILIEKVESVNTEFISRLSNLHPDLTKNERNLSSLLRIDLSTKDIANIVGSSPKTVNMARYRLRKKLNLETDELLSDYMKKI